MQADSASGAADTAQVESTPVESPVADVAAPESASIESEKAEAAKAEAARLESEKAEAARLETEKAPAAKLEAEKAEAAKIEAEKAAAAKIEAEKAAKSRTAKTESPKVEARKMEDPALEEAAPEVQSQSLEPQTVAEAAVFPPLEAAPATVERDRKMDLLLDLTLPVAIELGRTNLQIRDILDLRRGSVVEFEKLASEPVDVIVNGKKMAEGEVVVIEKHFGIRITNLIESAERVKSLGK